MLLAALQRENRRLILWVPVCFAAGALIYLSLKAEPARSVVFALPPVLWFAGRSWLRQTQLWPVWAAAALMLMGFCWSQTYTHWRHVTMLKKEVSFVTVTGRIDAIADVPKGHRITLSQVQIEGMQPAQTPKRVRLKLRGNARSELLAGQHVSLRAGLLPPSGPVMPTGFDFARYFYFQDIGAVGYAIPPVQLLQPANTSGFWLWLTAKRASLSRRIREQMSSPEGAVAAALMMGDRAAIPQDVNNMMRDTNLSHILAISGTHMALMTGMLFFALRWVLAAMPATRHLRQPKKLAAALALCAGAAYLLVAGLPISASRAFVMVALVLGAILLDRQVMPMRSLAVAALLLLLINPSYAMQPGFQLSFAATAALIAWYEAVRHRAQQLLDTGRMHKRAMLYVAGVLMTSFVAELATAPLVLYHFNNLSYYGLLANLLVMPLVSFLIMPFIVLSFVLLPLGAEFLALEVVGYGIQAMLAVAEWVSSIPGAQHYVMAPPAWGMAVAGLGMAWLGMAWLFIWQRAWRYAGLFGIAAGMASLFTTTPPDLFISADAKQIAGRNAQGQWRMLKGRGYSFTPQQWANGMGENAFSSIAKTGANWRCDIAGCLYEYAGKRIAFPTSFQAQAQDCQQADWVVTPFYLYDSFCRTRVIDKRDRQENGHYWLWLSGDEITSQSTRNIQGTRPWAPALQR